MADEVSKNGVYVDSKTGKVVNSPPEEGIQLVPAGGTIDSAAAAAIEAAKAAHSGAGEEPETEEAVAAKGRPRQ
jgi:hypothetical protein